ncbi:MAG: hypothetical protein GY787_11325 [Alteromonadales bacterium]|nr:hypothetical protein [Alteromonadales bacterium]
MENDNNKINIFKRIAFCMPLALIFALWHLLISDLDVASLVSFLIALTYGLLTAKILLHRIGQSYKRAIFSGFIFALGGGVLIFTCFWGYFKLMSGSSFHYSVAITILEIWALVSFICISPIIAIYFALLHKYITMHLNGTKTVG